MIGGDLSSGDKLINDGICFVKKKKWPRKMELQVEDGVRVENVWRKKRECRQKKTKRTRDKNKIIKKIETLKNPVLIGRGWDPDIRIG